MARLAVEVVTGIRWKCHRCVTCLWHMFLCRGHECAVLRRSYVCSEVKWFCLWMRVCVAFGIYLSPGDDVNWFALIAYSCLMLSQDRCWMIDCLMARGRPFSTYTKTWLKLTPPTPCRPLCLSTSATTPTLPTNRPDNELMRSAVHVAYTNHLPLRAYVHLWWPPPCACIRFFIEHLLWGLWGFSKWTIPRWCGRI